MDNQSYGREVPKSLLKVNANGKKMLKHDLSPDHVKDVERRLELFDLYLAVPRALPRD